MLIWIHLFMLIIENKIFWFLIKVKGLDDNTLTGEKEYSIIFTEQNKKLYLCLHYNGLNSYTIVNGVKIY